VVVVERRRLQYRDDRAEMSQREEIQFGRANGLVKMNSKWSARDMHNGTFFQMEELP
jgi:hypothetical protein